MGQPHARLCGWGLAVVPCGSVVLQTMADGAGVREPHSSGGERMAAAKSAATETPSHSVLSASHASPHALHKQFCIKALLASQGEEETEAQRSEMICSGSRSSEWWSWVG